MVQEWFVPHNKIFLFIAIVAGLADVAYILGHKILCTNRGVIVSWVLYAVCFVLIVKYQSKPEEPKPHITLVLVGTTDFPSLNLPLTNSFLFSDDPEVITIRTNGGLVLAPIPTVQSKCSLCFVR